METMDGRLGALRVFWDGKRGHRPLPERRDFLAEEFRPWFGHLCIVRLEEPAARFRVTLAGMEVVRYYGRDLTGRCLDDEMVSDGYGWLVDTYRECARKAAPHTLHLPPLSFSGTTMPLDRLMLPCGHEARVDTIIVGLYPAA